MYPNYRNAHIMIMHASMHFIVNLSHFGFDMYLTFSQGPVQCGDA